MISAYTRGQTVKGPAVPVHQLLKRPGGVLLEPPMKKIKPAPQLVHDETLRALVLHWCAASLDRTAKPVSTLRLRDLRARFCAALGPVGIGAKAYEKLARTYASGGRPSNVTLIFNKAVNEHVGSDLKEQFVVGWRCLETFSAASTTTAAPPIATSTDETQQAILRKEVSARLEQQQQRRSAESSVARAAAAEVRRAAERHSAKLATWLRERRGSADARDLSDVLTQADDLSRIVAAARSEIDKLAYCYKQLKRGARSSGGRRRAVATTTATTKSDARRAPLSAPNALPRSALDAPLQGFDKVYDADTDDDEALDLKRVVVADFDADVGSEVHF